MYFKSNLSRRNKIQLSTPKEEFIEVLNHTQHLHLLHQNSPEKLEFN